MSRKKQMSVFEQNVSKIEDTLDIRPVNLEKGDKVADSVRTGSLALDLILGGGWLPGRWTTLVGAEGSGKSTLMYKAMASSVHLNGSYAFLFDHEGTSDPWYLAKHDVVIDNEKFRYYQPDTGQKTFQLISRVLNEFEDRDRGPAQAVFFLDSLPAMLPKDRSEDDEKNPTASSARMFSESIPLIKTKLAQKRCTVVAANQIRTNPRQLYGNPQYEPGGEALRHYSDCRVKCVPCAVPKPGKGRILDEPCWDGSGIDRYQYSKLTTIKHKGFSPFRETIVRFCFESKGEPGYGMDSVWDTYQFLDSIGAVDRVRGGGMKILLDDLDFKCDWLEFKALILNPNSEIKVRDKCSELLESGAAFEMYFKKLGGGPTDEEPEPEQKDGSTTVEE